MPIYRYWLYCLWTAVAVRLPTLVLPFEADKRALQALRHVDLLTSLGILKKRWRSLDRHERLIVDSIIRLTFRTHWYVVGRRVLMRCGRDRAVPPQPIGVSRSDHQAPRSLVFHEEYSGFPQLDSSSQRALPFLFRLAAHWLRFLESCSSASRKLPYLDRLIWQYRNLYPGLTPAIAWAVWDVAQALLSLGVRPCSTAGRILLQGWAEGAKDRPVR